MQLCFFLNLPTYFFSRGSASLSHAKEPSQMLTAVSWGGKKAQRFSIPVLWIGCNRSIQCWWTYWNCGHAAQCHFPGRRLPETSPSASWTRRSEESENILVVFYNKSAVRRVRHPYLHHGSDELGQHGQGESEDVEKRNGSEGFLCS